MGCKSSVTRIHLEICTESLSGCPKQKSAMLQLLEVMSPNPPPPPPQEVLLFFHFPFIFQTTSGPALLSVIPSAWEIREINFWYCPSPLICWLLMFSVLSFLAATVPQNTFLTAEPCLGLRSEEVVGAIAEECLRKGMILPCLSCKAWMAASQLIGWQRVRRGGKRKDAQNSRFLLSLEDKGTLCFVKAWWRKSLKTWDGVHA